MHKVDIDAIPRSISRMITEGSQIPIYSEYQALIKQLKKFQAKKDKMAK